MSEAASDEHASKSQKIFAWISVVSERRSADEISALIGLSPDRAWKIGDRRGKTDIIERTHGWILNSRLRSEEHTSELQSRLHLVCRLLLEKKKKHPGQHLSGRTPSIAMPASVTPQ